MHHDFERRKPPPPLTPLARLARGRRDRPPRLPPKTRELPNPYQTSGGTLFCTTQVSDTRACGRWIRPPSGCGIYTQEVLQNTTDFLKEGEKTRGALGLCRFGSSRARRRLRGLGG